MTTHKYHMTIATESGLTDDESQRCLRAMLKAMLRQYGVRCLSVLAVQPSDTPQNAPESTQAAPHED
jgi:hypothetical protein